MKKRTLAWALALLLALALLCARAEEIDGSWAYASGGAPLQEWLDMELTEGAGSASDNCVLCLLRSGAALDYSKYIDAAAEKLASGISNASTRQRTALCLIACGAPERVPEGTVDESAGKLGVMSWVWALHLLNGGAPSKQFTAESVAEKLIESQLPDGGWRVTGDAGDVDVTSMCLQALACAPDRNDALNDAIDRALAFLSDHQKESGGFASMGEENAESAAQVLLALASLNIVPDDARFVKNGRTVLDALADYRLASGGYAHLAGGEANPTATAQALQALIALEHPGEPFYDFSGARTTDEALAAQSRLPAWKRVAFIAIGVLALAGIAFALTRKRARLKRLLAVLIAAGIAACAVWFVQIDRAADYYDPNALSKAPSGGSVTLSIVCDSVAGRADDGTTPADGMILPPTEVPFAEGDSVFDALTIAARANSIQLEYAGTESTAYINGINNLYEFAYGELSGWLYSVNGERVSVSCGSCPLRDGDVILWEYTTDMGGVSQ